MTQPLTKNWPQGYSVNGQPHVVLFWGDNRIITKHPDSPQEYCWNTYGRSMEGGSSSLELIRAIKRGWINVWDINGDVCSTAHDTLQEAKDCEISDWRLLARIKFTEGEGLI